MTTIASHWIRNKAGELLLTAQNELQLSVWCNDCENLSAAVPGLVLPRAGGILEALMLCPEHGPIYPWEFLPKLPPTYQVVDGRIKKQEQDPTPLQA